MAAEIDITEIVAIFEAAFPNFHPTERTVEVYHQVLKDIDPEPLRVATFQAVSEAGRKFAPSVGELRGIVFELQRIADGVPDSYSAWMEVTKMIVMVGHGATPEFSHPLIDKAVRALGWNNLCMSENQMSDRARFIEAYEQFQSRYERDEMMLPQVKGYIENEKIKALTDKMSVPRLIHPHTGEIIE